MSNQCESLQSMGRGSAPDRIPASVGRARHTLLATSSTRVVNPHVLGELASYNEASAMCSGPISGYVIDKQ